MAPIAAYNLNCVLSVLICSCHTLHKKSAKENNSVVSQMLSLKLYCSVKDTVSRGNLIVCLVQGV